MVGMTGIGCWRKMRYRRERVRMADRKWRRYSRGMGYNAKYVQYQIE
jgi:hypothetical protein